MAGLLVRLHEKRGFLLEELPRTCPAALTMLAARRPGDHAAPIDSSSAGSKSCELSTDFDRFLIVRAP